MTSREYRRAVSPNALRGDAFQRSITAAHRAALTTAAVRTTSPWCRYPKLGSPGKFDPPTREVTISFPGITDKRETWSEGVDLEAHDSGRLAWLRRARPDLAARR